MSDMDELLINAPVGSYMTPCRQVLIVPPYSSMGDIRGWQRYAIIGDPNVEILLGEGKHPTKLAEHTEIWIPSVDRQIASGTTDGHWPLAEW